MRTQKEINSQIKLLLKEKSGIPEFSLFGDNNWEPIEVMICVLKGEKKCNDYLDGKEHSDLTYYAAYDAEEWLNNTNLSDLVEN